MANYKKKNKGNYKPQLSRKDYQHRKWSWQVKVKSLKKTIVNFLSQIKEWKNDES